LAVQRPFCIYQEYDPATLAPVNDTTQTRVAEMASLRSIVPGRTVLDIGCNAGLVSILAAQWGARRVTAVDVSQPSIALLKDVAARHALPIDSRVANFAELSPERDRSDVVLMLEVIHWLVAQGSKIDPVIEKLSSLTGQTLVIETPWSVDEPSIRQQTTLTSADYGMDLIVESLLRRFDAVEFRHFSRYYGADSDSKRVMVVAQRS
jgi:trans-aconitate methyltransferase